MSGLRIVELRGWVYPVVLVFQLLLGVLQLLAFFRVRNYPHDGWERRVLLI